MEQNLILNFIKKLRKQVIYQPLVNLRKRKSGNNSVNPPPFLIVCSGSSGSHLLGILLDSHSEIAVGPELNLFNKAALYEDYELVQEKIEGWMRTSLSTDGFAIGHRFLDTVSDYYWDPRMIPVLAQSTDSFRDFSDTFFSHFLRKRHAKMWGEKTPSNINHLHDFLEIYPEAKVIHLVRNGQDVVASLRKRGLSLAQAGGIWLSSVSSLAQFEQDSRMLVVRFEDLVTQTKDTLGRIFHHLKVSYEPVVEQRHHNKYWEKVIQKEFVGNIHQTWTYHPLFSSISSDSIGKYQTTLSQDELLAFHHMALTNDIKSKKLKCRTVSDWLLHYGYIPEPLDANLEIAEEYQVQLLEYQKNKGFDSPIIKFYRK